MGAGPSTRTYCVSGPTRSRPRSSGRDLYGMCIYFQALLPCQPSRPSSYRRSRSPGTTRHEWPFGLRHLHQRLRQGDVREGRSRARWRKRVAGDRRGAVSPGGIVRAHEQRDGAGDVTDTVAAPGWRDQQPAPALLALQRAAGNRAVTAFVQRGNPPERRGLPAIFYRRGGQRPASPSAWARFYRDFMRPASVIIVVDAQRGAWIRALTARDDAPGSGEARATAAAAENVGAGDSGALANTLAAGDPGRLADTVGATHAHPASPAATAGHPARPAAHPASPAGRSRTPGTSARSRSPTRGRPSRTRTWLAEPRRRSRTTSRSR